MVSPSIPLDSLTRPMRALTASHGSGKLICLACAHRCKIGPGQRGICQVRYNGDQGLQVPWGYTAGLAIDPIEKKPFFHVLPGAPTLSFGMLGCDLHCAFCQNWFSSQTLRDQRSTTSAQPIDPEQIVSTALRRGCRIIVSTYNEPLISAEWAHAVFTLAKAAGLLAGFVSNGHATEQVLRHLEPVIDLYKVDLKAFREQSYRSLGGRLQAVTETIASLHRRKIWVEVVTLVVPGFNDDPGELQEMAAFIAGVSVDIPWHVTAFHPDYEMCDRGPTPTQTLQQARQLGLAAGLRYVYAGNRPGSVRRGEETSCHRCGSVLIERRGFAVTAQRLTAAGDCPDCGTTIAGVWQGRLAP